jgi:hypothetical protein
VNKKALSFGVALVALMGSLLAAFIPAASASRVPHATACDYASSDVPCSVQISGGSTVAPGTVLDPGVTVTGNSGGTLTIDDNGQTVTVPKGETVEIASDGSYVLLSQSGPYGRGAIHVLSGKVKSIYLHPSLGITFGANHSVPLILKYVTYTNGTSRLPVASRVYNRPHGQLFSLLKVQTATPTVSVNGRILEFTRAEIRFIKAHHAKKDAVLMTVRTTTNKVYSFKILVPISKLTVETFPKK